MTIDNQQVVALNYVLHLNGENNEKSSCRKKSDAEIPYFLYGGRKWWFQNLKKASKD